MKNLANLIIAAAIVFVVVTYLWRHSSVWQFDHLEENTRQEVTAAELQTWATNLLAAYPVGGDMRVSTLGTNFPEPLRELAPKLGPWVSVMPEEGPDRPGWVRVDWGSGFLGHKCFEIGPTNFVGRGQAWAPGVYFYKH